MTVYFYNNTKRLNSTKAPTTAATSVDCVLKQGTSLINPTLIVNLSSKPTYNYMSFDNRYYWITDIVSTKNDLWEISGRIDVLYTFKKHIQGTTAFVVFDSTPNTQIPDNRVGIKTDCDTYTSTTGMPWSFSSGAGTYCIATTGIPDEFDIASLTYTTNTRAGTGVYTIDKNRIEQLGFDVAQFIAEFTVFYNDVSTNIANDISIITQTSADYFEYIGNCCQGGFYIVKDVLLYSIKYWGLVGQYLFAGGSAMDNIKSAYWLPFEIPAMALTQVTKPLALGSFPDYVGTLYHIDEPVISSVAVSVTIPWHYNDWRDVTCTELMLYIPLIGCINIPTETVKGNNTLLLKFSLNTYSGALACEIRCNGGHIGTYGTNTAMPILIGNSNPGLLNVINSISPAFSGKAAGFAGAAIGTVGSAFTNNPTTVGGIGGGAGIGLTNDIVCVCRCHDTVQSPSALLSTIGTPTQELKTLSGSGFCQCMNAQVNCGSQTGEPDPTQTEIEMINGYLNSGIYLE